MNFRYKFIQFMSGRYGSDILSGFLVFIAIILSAVNLVFRSLYVQLVVYAIIGYALFRFLSRNIEARRREKIWFVNKLKFIKKRRDFRNQKKADKFHVYKKCPSCKAILRLPHRKGKHKTVCPRCSKKFTVKVRK